MQQCSNKVVAGLSRTVGRGGQLCPKHREIGGRCHLLPCSHGEFPGGSWGPFSPSLQPQPPSPFPCLRPRNKNDICKNDFACFSTLPYAVKRIRPGNTPCERDCSVRQAWRVSHARGINGRVLFILSAILARLPREPLRCSVAAHRAAAPSRLLQRGYKITNSNRDGPTLKPFRANV